MIASSKIEPGSGSSQGQLSLDSKTKDNAKPNSAFDDMPSGGDRNGMLKGAGQDDLMSGGNGEFAETFHAVGSEDAGNTHHAPRIDREVEASSPTPPQANNDRDDQMVAIRQILSDLEEDPDLATEPEVEERAAPAAPEPSLRRRAWDDEHDKLDSQLDNLTKAVRAAKRLPVASGYDARKLRRSHEKRAKKLQIAEERRKKSGAFLTGFTLVSVVTATMVGLYVLHPQVIAASPQMAPAINEYVVTVDRYRVVGNERAAEWTAWLAERFGKLTGKEK